MSNAAKIVNETLKIANVQNDILELANNVNNSSINNIDKGKFITVLLDINDKLKGTSNNINTLVSHIVTANNTQLESIRDLLKENIDYTGLL